MAKATGIIYKLTMMFQAIFWVVAGVNMFVTAPNHYIIASLMIANGAAFVLLFYLITKKGFFIRACSFLFLFVNLALTLTDQMGFFDYIILLLNVAAIACLIYMSAEDVKQISK